MAANYVIYTNGKNHFLITNDMKLYFITRFEEMDIDWYISHNIPLISDLETFEEVRERDFFGLKVTTKHGKTFYITYSGKIDIDHI